MEPLRPDGKWLAASKADDAGGLPSAEKQIQRCGQRFRSLGYLAFSSRQAPLDSDADPKDKIADYESSRKAIVLAMSGQLPQAVAMFDGVLARNPEFLDTRNIIGLTQ